MVHVIVDPSDSNRVLHVEPRLRPRTAAEIAAGHLIFEWPDSLGGIHIGGTVTITSDAITAHAGHTLPTDSAQLLARARRELQAMVSATLGGIDANQIISSYGVGNTSRNIFRNQYKEFAAYGWRACSGTDGAAAHLAVDAVRRCLMPSEINGAGIWGFGVYLTVSANSVRTAWSGVHTARNLVLWNAYGDDIEIATGVASASWSQWNNVRPKILAGTWS